VEETALPISINLSDMLGSYEHPIVKVIFVLKVAFIKI